MMAKMKLKLLLSVASLLLGASHANPVDSLGSQLQTAQCGQKVEVRIGLEDELAFSSDYLLNELGDLPSNCNVSWRIALEALPKDKVLENWGIQVEGDVDFVVSSNAETCASFLQVTDEDEEGDVSSIKEIECGERTFDVRSYEDSVTLTLSTGDEVHGQGFHIRVKPFYGCGGMYRGVSGDSFPVISPDFPGVFPANVVCMWDVGYVKEHEGYTGLRFECEEFSLLKIKRDPECRREFLRLQAHDESKGYCKKSLEGPNRAKSYPDTKWMTMHFRSGDNRMKNTGFNCRASLE